MLAPRVSSLSGFGLMTLKAVRLLVREALCLALLMDMSSSVDHTWYSA